MSKTYFRKFANCHLARGCHNVEQGVPECSLFQQCPDQQLLCWDQNASHILWYVHHVGDTAPLVAYKQRLWRGHPDLWPHGTPPDQTVADFFFFSPTTGNENQDKRARSRRSLSLWVTPSTLLQDTHCSSTAASDTSSPLEASKLLSLIPVVFFFCCCWLWLLIVDFGCPGHVHVLVLLHFGHWMAHYLSPSTKKDLLFLLLLSAAIVACVSKSLFVFRLSS